ncbi:MXAN_6577-like cysteine-rich protein [Sorangium sp. So ce1014]|uniref:MXAN_6577-like cysteine-rich protein n=1 Tax=Sorangium sp. So ce1014 TaxID=3133326 RepID=UPI003F5FCA7E
MPCDDGLALCGGACTDTQADRDNCGDCDSVCASGQRCEAGECVGEDKGAGGSGDDLGSSGTGGALCAPGLALCSEGCVDLDIHPHHCGGCGQACPIGQPCEDGACRCDAGLAACDGGCADLSNDPLHCGSCEIRCAFNQTCMDGACLCDEGLTDCGGRCVVLASDPAHCGACGAACDAGLVCQAGTCTCVIGEHEDLGSTVPQVVRGTTLDADTYFGLACVAAGSTEVVYRFTAGEVGTYTFDTAGSSYDTAIAVLGFAACDELACNDDRGRAEAGASVALDEGEGVLVVVSGYNGAQGDFVLSIDRAAPPVCPVGNIDSTLPQAVNGDTWTLGDALVPTCGSLDTPDASYTFTAPYTGRYVFDTAGSSYDTVLELRNGTCAGPVISCNNDNTWAGTTSRIVASLSARQTVVAIVDGIAGESGPFTLNVTEYVPAPCPELVLGTTFPQRVTGTTAIMDRESDLSAPCADGAGPEATYAFTAPAYALYTFDTFGSAFDTLLHLHDGTCSGPSLGCNDDSSYVQSQVKALLEEGQTIVVVVDGSSRWASGAFTLNVSQTMAPPCPQIDLGSAAPQTVTGTTAEAIDILRSTCGDAGGRDATYSFTAPVAGTYLFDTFGSSFDTVLQILNGSCRGTSLGCNDDSGGLQSRVFAELTAGQTVIIGVDGIDGVDTSAGDYVLHVDRFLGQGTCSTAIDLGSELPLTRTGTTSSHPNLVAPTCGGQSNAPEMVFTYTAPVSGRYVIDTNGSSFDTILHVHTSGCKGLELGCDDSSGGSGPSRLIRRFNAGQVITVVVDGYGDASGDFTLHISPADP